MFGLRIACLAVVAFVTTGLVVPAAVQAQDAGVAPCRLCSADQATTRDAKPTQPLRLEVASRLDFDKVVFEGNGTALLALSPGGVARLSGAAMAAGARAMPGTVVVRGDPGRAVRVDLPREVVLYGSSGGTLRIDRLVTDLPSFPRIGDDGNLSFRFGGDLALSGDTDGSFHGTIDITVDYL